jgi:hypothetical protein
MTITLTNMSYECAHKQKIGLKIFRSPPEAKFFSLKCMFAGCSTNFVLQVLVTSRLKRIFAVNQGQIFKSTTNSLPNPKFSQKFLKLVSPLQVLLRPRNSTTTRGISRHLATLDMRANLRERYLSCSRINLVSN